MISQQPRFAKVNPVVVAVVPAAVFFSILLIYNAYKVVAPSAFTIAKSEEVEAMEVMQGLKALRSNGVPLAQAESLRGGGSSRLIVTHPARGGGFLLTRGEVSHGFLMDKLELDKMLHLRFARNEIQVLANNKPVDAVMLLARTETTPLRVDAVSPQPDVDIFDTLFANQTLVPVPPGLVTAEKFTSDQGMLIETGMGAGRQGVVSFGDSLELEFTLDPQSLGWVEMPRRMAMQHTAVGGESLLLGVLIPLSQGSRGPFTIQMFGETIATVSAP